MKRTANGQAKVPKSKPPVPEYCDVSVRKNDNGEALWPADVSAIDKARDFLKQCASDTSHKVVLLPDKDADGLTSGVQIYRTLETLGLPPSNIVCHLHARGGSIFDDVEREAIANLSPTHLIILDQGSISAPTLNPTNEARTLLLDHHLSDVFPEDTLAVSACHYPPVATTSLLTYEICKPLDPTLEEKLAYLCAIGTHGDLGTTLKWLPPFPDLTPVLKQYTKKSISTAISLLNAPRRTALYDVKSAWDALLSSTSPKDLENNRRLQAARFEINDEVEKHTHTPPKFTPDGKIAVLKINTRSQVHPLIATRWAGYLSSTKLEIVMVANYGYHDSGEIVNFSCRIARGAKGRDPPVNIIQTLRDAVAGEEHEALREKMGVSFARGHKEASGGVIPRDAFEEFMAILRVGEKVEKIDGQDGGKTKKAKTEGSPQKNTLGNYFMKKS